MGDGFALVENIVKSEQNVYIITESTDTNSHTTCIPVSHHTWVHTRSVDWKWGYVNFVISSTNVFSIQTEMVTLQYRCYITQYNHSVPQSQSALTTFV